MSILTATEINSCVILGRETDQGAEVYFRVDIFRRYISPLTCFTFAILGCATGINRQSKTDSITRRFILVVASTLIYHTFNFLMNYFCLSQVIPIHWGMFVPAFIVFTIAMSILVYNNQLFTIFVHMYFKFAH